MCNRKLKLLNCCGMRQAGRLWDRVVVCNAYAQYVYLICSCTGCSGGMNNRASPIYKKPMANGDFTIQKFLVLNERGCHIIRLILNFFIQPSFPSHAEISFPPTVLASIPCTKRLPQSSEDQLAFVGMTIEKGRQMQHYKYMVDTTEREVYASRPKSLQ